MTLLELILALGLTILLLGAIAMAIRLNLRTLDARRTQVEEAQLARAVLRMIGEDLRCAVRYEPQDMEAANQMASGGAMGQAANMLGGALGGAGGGGGGLGSALGAAAGGANANAGGANAAAALAGAGGGLGGQANAAVGGSGMGGAGMGGQGAGSGGTGFGGAGGSADAGGETAPVENLGEEVYAAPIPGLFGSQYEMQIDVSRLPRVDQYQKLLEGTVTGIADIPSDVKTVAYYVRSEPDPLAIGAAQSNPNSLTARDAARPGLVRRELDRAVTRYAMDNGTASELTRGGDLVAPEVVYLEFSYFDGIDWYSEWDSAQMGGLPLAVEIIVGIQPGMTWNGQSAANPAEATAAGKSPPEPLYFRHVVRLPAGRPLPPEDLSGEGGMSASDPAASGATQP